MTYEAAGNAAFTLKSGSPASNGGDIIYEALPAKAQAFFTEAIRTMEFDWLFKCDDDTYVDLGRLPNFS